MHLTFGPAGERHDEYTVVGIPYENPSFRPGASDAPTAIREASRSLEPYIHRMDLDIGELPLGDVGDIPRGPHEDIALHLDLDAEFPVFLGGDHSATPFLVGSFYDDPVAVVSLDAHLDFREEFRGDPLSNACSSRRLCELDAVSELVVIGARTGSEEEWDSELRRVRSDELSDPQRVGERITDEFDRVHLSVDMDVFDPGHAPAVANPEPMGLSPGQVRRFVDSLAPSLVGMDVVEIVPDIDDGNTALLAAWLVRETLGLVEVSG